MTRTKSPVAGGYIIAGEEDEILFRSYTEQRDRIREVMGRSLFPNLDLAVNLYANLDRDIQNGGALDDDDLRAYHEKLMGPIAPYVEDIRKMARGICDIMQAIETAAPGTFGIPLPSTAPTPAHGETK